MRKTNGRRWNENHYQSSFVSLRNVNNEPVIIFILFTTRSKVGKLGYIPWEYTITDSNRFVYSRHFSPRCLHRGKKFRFFSTLDTYANGRVGRRIDRYGGAISPGSGEPNHLRGCTRRIGDEFAADSRRSFIPLREAIHKISKLIPPYSLPPPLPPSSSSLAPLVVYEYVFHVRGFDRFPINENAVLNTVKRGTANATIYAARYSRDYARGGGKGGEGLDSSEI